MPHTPVPDISQPNRRGRWLRWLLAFVAVEIAVELFLFARELWQARTLLHLLGV